MTEPSNLRWSKIEFPCENYFISVVVTTHDGFTEKLEEIITTRCRGYDPKLLKITESKTGKYQSFRFSITADSEIQLRRLHDAFKATGYVHMVL